MPIDDRIIRVNVTVNGNLKVINKGTDVEKHLAVTATGSKFASATQNETIIKIANLDRAARDFLSTEGTPFNRIRQKHRQKITLESGRIKAGIAVVFKGDITLVTLSQPPDIWTTIRAITSQYNKGDIISTNEGALSNLSTIAKKAADTLGLSFQFEADDKQIANYGYTGSATKQIDKIEQLGNIDAFVDDDKMVVKNRGVPISGRTRLISKETGMVGLPEFTDFGVKVRWFFDIHSKVGQKAEIKSQFNPSANGKYSIYKLDFNLTNRDVPFYYVAETLRQGAIL